LLDCRYSAAVRQSQVQIAGIAGTLRSSNKGSFMYTELSLPASPECLDRCLVCQVQRSNYGDYAPPPSLMIQQPMIPRSIDNRGGRIQNNALGVYLVSSRSQVIRSFLSLAFFRPPKAILVPGMYFLGFSRYSNRVSSFHVMPFCLLASV
jgi:hypothetical protein